MSLPSGILLVNKPVGPTSHDVVARIRKVAGMKRVGHAGTLDPFASGLLLVLLGQATRLAEYLIPLDKSYQARARLGIETTTHDPEGETVREDSSWSSLSAPDVAHALEGFHGRLLQEPPVYSAKKVRGESAHRRVRRGEDVRLEPTEVTVHEIELLAFQPPTVEFHVRCSSGTYIRALARDLGRQLGPGAHLTGLIRTSIGPFPLEESVPLDSLISAEAVKNWLRPPAVALGHIPTVEVEAGDALRIRQGRPLPKPDGGFRDGTPVGILQGGELLAVGQVDGDLLRPRKVLGNA